MKRPKKQRLAKFGAGLVASAILTPTAFAASGTWTNLGGGSWPTTTNWAGGTVGAGADFVADFSTLNITAARTINLDGARTIGLLKFGDATTASHDWTLATGTGGALTLSVSSGLASVNMVNRNATISAVIAGTNGLEATGPATNVAGGTLILSGANTFTGGLKITGANVQLNNNAAAGNNLISIATSPFAAAATDNLANKLVINGGVTIANNVEVAAGANPLVGRGIIEQVGTGQATVNGTITINGGMKAGGHLLGGTAVGNELVLNGAISSTVQLGQREGRVIYRGRGTGFSSFGVTGTALVGTTNGLPEAVNVSVGLSGAGTLDLNGFDQTISSLTMGSGANAGSLNVRGNKLTLNGNLTHVGTAVGNISGAGSIDIGNTPRTLTVANGAAANDLVVTSTSLLGSGGYTKVGAGTLAMLGSSVETSLDFTAGELNGNFTVGTALTLAGSTTLTPGSLTSNGTITTGSLAFGLGSTTLNVNLGPTGNSDLISTGALTSDGVTTINVSQNGGALAPGIYPVIQYAGATPGLGAFSLTPFGRADAVLEDAGGAIRVKVNSNDSVTWDGTNSTEWTTNPTDNWKLNSSANPTDFVVGDDVTFADAPTNASVDITANVSPSTVKFTNTTATTYTVTGAGGISGTANITKSGDGTVVLRAPSGYVGATSVLAGTLELDHDAAGNVVLTGTSGVALSAGTTLKLTRDDGPFTFNRSISGSGTVEVNGHSSVGSTTAHGLTLSGNNALFIGQLNLPAPQSGTYRITSATPANLGSSTINVSSGAQLFTANGVFPNAITIAGNGFQDASGLIGALRLEAGATWAGPVVVDSAGSRIGCYNNTATVSGPISGGDLIVNANNYNNNHTLIFTGTNTYGKTTIGGENVQIAGVSSRRLNIGNGGTSGTLGTGPVEIVGDGQNGILGIDRADGYTLATGQTITGITGGSVIANSISRTFLDVDTTGTGLNMNGNAITLGAATTTLTGGQIRVAQARNGAILNIDSSATSGVFRNGSNFSGTTNVKSGGSINTASIHTAIGSAAANGSVLNIEAGATVNANYFTIGEVASAGGIVNQTGGDVTIIGQMRAGHYGTESSVYNLSAGTLTMTGADATNFPYTTVGGAANVVGDNNLNGLPANSIVGGGIYLGIDGHGVLNQSGGTITTNWLVLDNRGDSPAGLNMPNGDDTYALSGGTLVLKTSAGIVSRNATAAVLLSGGTIQADTGVSPNLDSNKITVSGPVTLDTNGANTFTLYGPLAGTGTASLIGGGTLLVTDGGAGANTTPGGTMPGGSLGTASLNIGATSTLRTNRTLADSWTGSLSGAGAFVKENAGFLAISGSGAAFTGTTTVNGGRLDVPNDFASPTIVVADAATLGGEATTTNLTLGTTTGSTLVINPATTMALTATNLTVNGTILIDFSAPPAGTGSITVLNYTTKTGTGTFDLAGAANFRPFTVTDTGTSIVLNFANKDLVWTGTGGTFWDVNSSTNWDSAGAQAFFFGDAVRFDDTSTGVDIVTLTAPLNPSTVTVDSNTNNFTLVSGAGTSISGAATLTKLGSSTLTLSGTNTYSGKTTIGGGVLSIASEASLGNGTATNTIALSGGATLLTTATTNLGVNRNILVGTGGGKISAGTGLTLTVPGKLSGNQSLNLTGGGLFVLSGDNSGYSGNVTVDSIGATAGAATLRLTNSKAITSGSITLIQPDAPSANGSATGLDLANVILPADVTLNMTSNLVGTTSFRTQLTSTVGVNSVNGPISVTGNSIVQVSTHATNGITLNGPISAGTAGFTGTFFIRGAAGSGVVNGVVNMPAAVLAKTDAATWTINSTGNVWATTSVVSAGSLKIGAHNALPIASTLSIGQPSDANASSMDLNGFNQEVAALAYVAGNGNSTRGITNTVATTLSTLTVNNAAAVTYGTSTGITGGLLAGNLALVKIGAGDLTLGGRNTFTGNITVNEGTLIATGPSNANTNGGLGSSNTAGRTITANGTGIRLNALRVFGNGFGNANLPTIILNNGATLTANRYSVVGAINLNGSTLTSDHGADDSASLQAYQLRGAVTVGGSAPSTISGAGDYPGVHLDTNTQFNVADVTGSAASDLIVSTQLLNGSDDYFGAISGMTKTGAGTMVITATSIFGGPTNVAQGTLLIQDEFNSPVTVAATGVLGGNGILTSTLNANVPGAKVAPGSSVGLLTVGGEVDLSGGGVLAIEVDDALPGEKSDRLAALGLLNLSGATLDVSVAGAAAQPAYIIATYDTLVGSFTSTNLPPGYTVDYAYNDGFTTKNVALVPAVGGYDGWASGFGLNPLTNGLPSVDHDKDGIANGIEFVLGTDPTATTGADKLPTAEVVGTDVIFTFRRTDLSSSANPGAEKSTSLTPAPSWSPITTGIVVENDGFGVGVDKVTVTIPKGAEPRLFVRLNVNIP